MSSDTVSDLDNSYGRSFFITDADEYDENNAMADSFRRNMCDTLRLGDGDDLDNDRLYCASESVCVIAFESFRMEI